jgi:hypothetical protein
VEELMSNDEKLKICNGCKQNLPISYFGKSNGATYPRSKCRECERALSKIRVELRKKHGLPPAEYKCPICNRNEDQLKGRGGQNRNAWCCDHQHGTNIFRGWLCHDCNKGLGFLGDDPEKCIRAAVYLKDSNGK